MKTSTSQATRRAAAAQSVKLQIIELLGIDELDYAVIQFETGICYLSLLLKDEYYEGFLQHSRVFWTWWKNQWLLRDEQFLNAARYSDVMIDADGRFCLDKDYKGYPRDYITLNAPANLASEIHPNGIVLRDSYAGMIALILDLNR